MAADEAQIVGKHFLNKVDTITEALKGNLKVDHNQTRLDYDAGQAVKVVVRRDWKPSTVGKVAVVTGGGSGHEPAFAGFVGEGFLTAAVCGNLFASPSTASVYQAIKAVATPEGVLVIIMQYTGDTLNFGAACRQAAAEGVKVKMLVVSDDAALPKDPEKDPLGKRNRGLAGTLLVQKIACAAADQGKTLEEVYKLASRAASVVKTLGCSSNSCKTFDAPRKNEIGDDEFELGLGIHGESGHKRIKKQSASELVNLMVNMIFNTDEDRNYLPEFEKGTKMVVLLNNLGSVTGIEMSVLSNCVIESLENVGAKVELFGAKQWMTSLDMHGFSITVMLAVDDFIVELLNAPASTSAWSPLKPLVSEIVTLPLVSSQKQFVKPEDAVNVINFSLFEKGTNALRNSREELNRLDGLVGDADCGSSMVAMCDLISQNVDEMPLWSYKQCVLFVGKVLQAAPGTSGAVYACLFSGIGSHLPENNDEVNTQVLGTAIENALNDLYLFSGAKKGDRTMLDALFPAVEKYLETEGDLVKTGNAAYEGAKTTATMRKAGAGRSQYLNEEALDGNMDPGALAASVFLLGLVEEKIEEN